MSDPDRAAAIRYAAYDMHEVEGWLSDSAATATVLLAQAQDREGIAGDIAEIGIHHGKYFILLAHFLNDDETGVAVDLFGRQEENIDESGRGDLARFRRNLAAYLGSSPRVVTLEADSLRLQAADLAGPEGRRFRIISIDGGHTPAHVLNDLALAESVLHERGFVVVDDFYNPAWPGVNEGVHRYWFGGGRLRPFAYGGNKLFLCRPEGWELWYGEAQRMAPHAVQRRVVRLVGTPALQFELETPARAFRVGPAARPLAAEHWAAHTAVLSRRPNVLAIMGDPWSSGFARFTDGTNSLAALCGILGPGGHLLHAVGWSLLDAPAWVGRFGELRRTLTDHPGVTLTFLCNEPAEVAAVEAAGFRGLVVPHNAFVKEDVFRIIEGERPFDAIYLAKMQPWKRHALAAKVPRLALVYDHHSGLDRRFEQVRRLLPDAAYLNGDPLAGTYRKLAPAEIVAALNHARVGLCLSEMEGGMYASIEYLLCGLPVVSTVSRGGRDLFFDERYCRIVEPSADAVAAAVAELIARDVPRERIRAATLEKMAPYRRRLVDLVDGIRLEAGEQPEGEALLRRISDAPWHIWTWRGVADIRRCFEEGASP